MNVPFNPIKGLPWGTIGRSAGYGAIGGAVTSAFSDDSSVIGGAINGAMIGGGIGVLGATAGNAKWRKGATGFWDKTAKPWIESQKSAVHGAVDQVTAGVKAGYKAGKRAMR